MTDDEVRVLRGAAAGDPTSARRLIDETGPVIYGYVFARVGGDEAVAEDIVQDTFVEAMRSAPTFRGDAALSTWMCAIARRRLARWYDQERRRAALDGAAGEHIVHTAAEPAAEVDERDVVIRALRRLSVVHREVLILKYLDGQSVAEIAEQMGRSRVQVQSLLQRGRDALRRELQVLP